MTLLICQVCQEKTQNELKGFFVDLYFKEIAQQRIVILVIYRRCFF